MGIRGKYTIQLLLVPVSFKKIFVALNTFQFIFTLLSCAVEFFRVIAEFHFNFELSPNLINIRHISMVCLNLFK